ncbi:ABC transporter ATP-binding protein [Priestia megaterium]|uniref:ABC transporter ATP-binding protein n=1 Tax=Priestia megaterium TaxID=1404 RepID=UPI00234F36BA|nr:ABC transporter ATP-binding protein [Priestia megaterium]MDC7783991.1 ABC transporter ATP-binding protein [Priestia megaterium]
MKPILKARSLTKVFGDKFAVRDINISLYKGEVFGLIGKNGSGKSTTLRMILNDINPTSGSLELFGKKINSRKHKGLYSRIGSFLSDKQLYHNLTVYENLDMHRKLMGIPSSQRTNEILGKLHLTEESAQIIRNLSLGTRVRVGLARAFLHYPELLVLDEPTNGLDPQTRRELRNIILNLSQYYETSVILASNALDEVEQLCSKVGVLHKGDLIEYLNKDELRKKRQTYIFLRVCSIEKATFILETQFLTDAYKITGEEIIEIYDQNIDTSEIVEKMVQSGVKVKEIKFEKSSLEIHFLTKIGEV